MEKALIEQLVFWCGIGHVGLCIGSLYIPKALRWEKHLQHLQPLLREMFWTYAGYILVLNFSFGMLSIFGSYELLDGSFLARSITFFIGLYWLMRIGLQFFYFDRSEAPTGLAYTLGEIALMVLFSAFTLTYLIAFFFNNRWI
jgi:hypothetical protein